MNLKGENPSLNLKDFSVGVTLATATAASRVPQSHSS